MLRLIPYVINTKREVILTRRSFILRSQSVHFPVRLEIDVHKPWRRGHNAV